MRLKLVACEVLAREVEAAAEASTSEIDATLLRFGLHDVGPEEMSKALQAEIDRAEGEGRFEAVALAYGLCNNGTVGLGARKLPLVLPRAHDCITMLLGSRERYRAEFEREPGTYWLSPGWIERHESEKGELSVQARMGLFKKREEYARLYGEENADYLMETLHAETHYTRLALVDTGLGEVEAYRAHARERAAKEGLRFEEMKGDRSLLDRLLAGGWDAREFLVLAPGERVRAVYDHDEVVSAEHPSPQRHRDTEKVSGQRDER